MRRAYLFFVYIMASSSGTLYVGVSNNVYARSGQHKLGIGSAFCKKYKIDRLVYYEDHQYILNAVDRETEIKKWRRAKKVALIESMNPSWRDLRKDFELRVFLKQPQVPRGRDISLRST